MSEENKTPVSQNEDKTGIQKALQQIPHDELIAFLAEYIQNRPSEGFAWLVSLSAACSCGMPCLTRHEGGTDELEYQSSSLITQITLAQEVAATSAGIVQSAAPIIGCLCECNGFAVPQL